MKIYQINASHLIKNLTTRSALSRFSRTKYQIPSLPLWSIRSALIKRSISHLSRLPTSCPGCGGYAQIDRWEDPGFFSLGRKSVRAYLEEFQEPDEKEKPPALDGLSPSTVSATRETSSNELSSKQPPPSNPALQEAISSPVHVPVALPLCDRCHKLLHHSTGFPIAHPSIDSLQAIINETPYKQNHIYHVLDAADFPMSLIPDLHQRLSLNPQRSRNRRAKLHTFRQGRLMEMSYIITRADILAPTREQANRLMPYIVQVLRDALGHTAENLRLGNVKLVSAHRGWWTRELKNDVWSRGGCGWLVGKANVGKSHLLQSILPKGRSEVPESSHRWNAWSEHASSGRHGPEIAIQQQQESWRAEKSTMWDQNEHALNTLLPPKPLEMDYPTMPIVSPLPGTTAAPIRLPFGSGRGELIDLPGLNRNGFEASVAEEEKQGLILESRPKPTRITVKPGQSLRVGSMARITPYKADVVFLAFPFVPGSVRVTSGSAAGAETKDAAIEIDGPLDPQGGMKLAGIYDLAWDVTKQRSGPLTRKDALGLQVQSLPFIIFSVDVVLEGIGWIELAAQVRRGAFKEKEALHNSPKFPQIEIVSLGGRHITVRRPMNASLLMQGRPKKGQRFSGRKANNRKEI